MVLFFLSNFYVVQMNEGLPVEHTQEELQDIQAEEEHSQPCSGRKVRAAGTAAVASAAAEDAAEEELLLLAVAVQ